MVCQMLYENRKPTAAHCRIFAIGDTDGDGASDTAEYTAGTSATNVNSKFQISASVLSGGSVVFIPDGDNQRPRYFGPERRYALEQTTNINNPAELGAIPVTPTSPQRAAAS